MSEPNVTESEEKVWHAVYRVPKKNHDAMVQVCKQFNEMFKKYGGLRLEVFQLANTNVPTEGITNIANTVSANQDEEVWVELQYYGGKKHMDEVCTKLGKDENMGRNYKESLELLTPDLASLWASSIASMSRDKISDLRPLGIYHIIPRS